MIRPPLPNYDDSPPTTPKRDYDGASSVTSVQTPSSSKATTDGHSTAAAAMAMAGGQQRHSMAAAAAGCGFYAPVPAEFVPYAAPQHYGAYYPMPVYAPLPLFPHAVPPPPILPALSDYADPRAAPAHYAGLPMVMAGPHMQQPRAYHVDQHHRPNGMALVKGPNAKADRRAAKRMLRKQRSKSLDTPMMHRQGVAYAWPAAHHVQQPAGMVYAAVQQYRAPPPVRHHAMPAEPSAAGTSQQNNATTTTTTGGSPNTGRTVTNASGTNTELVRYAGGKLHQQPLARHLTRHHVLHMANGRGGASTLYKGGAHGQRSCARVCCKGHIRLLWIILFILVAGVLLGVVMGLTLVD